MLQISQLLPLEVIIPLMAALLCSIRNNYFYNSFLAVLTSSFGFIVSTLLFHHVSNTGTISYNMGGWSLLYGIQLKLTVLNSVILMLINFVTLIVSVYGLFIVKLEIEKKKLNLFYTAFLLCYTGLVGIIVTNDIFNLYVFLEISSLATYTLVASAGTRKAYIAAFDYLIIGTISATFYLIGVGFLYSMTGTLNMDVLSSKLQIIYGNRITLVGVIFIIIGLSIKSALFPLHLWLTKAYGYSNSIVTSFLSGTSTKVGIYILIKFIYFILGVDILSKSTLIRDLFVIFAFGAILFGAIYALIQDETKKLLAYSSVSQIGYIILAVFLNSNLVLVAAILQMISHSIAKSSIFMIDGCISHASANHENSNHSNSKISTRKNSSIKIYLLISSLSIVGMPITAGFISKLYLFNLTLNTHNYIASFIIILSSLITALYVWKLNKIIFKKAVTNLSFPSGLHIPLLSCSVLNLIIGIYPKPIIDILKAISL